jgi:hypothetical protein
MNTEYIENLLDRIAAALERIATHLEGGDVPDRFAGFVPTGVTCTATPEMLGSMDPNYAKAVQALVDMPNDELPLAAPAKPVTKDEVVKALNNFAKAHGMPAAKKVLQTFGEGLGSVDPSKYGELIALLKATS